MKNVLEPLLLCIGDVHISARNEWDREAAEAFLEWLEEYDFGPREQRELCFTGDVVDRDYLYGIDMVLLDKLFTIAISKFSTIYVCVGNHDVKRRFGKYQHPLMYVKSKPGVIVIENEQVVKTNLGFSMLVLPHYTLDDGRESVEHYNETKPFFTGKYDAVLAHTAKNFGMFVDSGVHFDEIDARAKFIGHVHTRDDPDYVGSVWPHSTAEEITAHPRCFKWITKTDAGELILPRFLSYKQIQYDKEEAVPDSGVYVTVFVVAGAPSNSAAKSRYPGVHLKKISRKNTVTILSSGGSSEEAVVFDTPYDAFQKWLKIKDRPAVSRRVISIINKRLANPN